MSDSVIDVALYQIITQTIKTNASEHFSQNERRLCIKLARIIHPPS